MTEHTSREVAYWRRIKNRLIETMRRCEPDYGESIDLGTQEILVRAVDRQFEDWIYDLSPPNSKEVTRAYEAPDENKPLLPDWDQ